MSRINESAVIDKMTALAHTEGTWTALNNDCVNVALSATPHMGGIELDKANGAANTLYAMAYRAAQVDLSHWRPEDRLVWVANAKAQTALVAAVIRMGADASNYLEWRFPVASMTASRFNLCSVPLGNAYITGAGISNWASVAWLAAGFLFTAETDALADLIVGEIGLRAAYFSQT